MQVTGWGRASAHLPAGTVRRGPLAVSLFGAVLAGSVVAAAGQHPSINSILECHPCHTFPGYQENYPWERKHSAFSLPDPSELGNSQYFYILRQYIYLHKFNKNLFSLELDTIENTGYITRALPGMSYLREMCTDSYMTRWLEGTKVDFTEPTQPRGRIGLAPSSQGSQQLPGELRKVISWWAQEPQDILGTLRREEFNQICRYCRETDDKVHGLAFLALRSLFTCLIWGALWKSSSKADLKSIYMVGQYSSCTYLGPSLQTNPSWYGYF